MSPLVEAVRHGRAVTVTLNDPPRRNALGHAMFDALDAALATAHEWAAAGADQALILRLRGAGPSFCAGFDLEACVGDDGQPVLASFLERLSSTVRALRRGPWVIVAEVQGAALAGGCALLSACDFVVVAESAQLGYPVHRIGVSPAVTAPLLSVAMGPGAARALLLSGELISGIEAMRRGLVTHAVADADLGPTVDSLCARLLRSGPVALLATRRWLDQLDDSDENDRFDAALRASLSRCGSDESTQLLSAFWHSRRSRP